MGNHGSRRDSRRSRNSSSSGSSNSNNNNANNNNDACGGQAVHALKRVEDLRGGPPVDAYDKLIAWLAEMAESDNVHLDTSVFVKQLTSVCDNANGNRTMGGLTPSSSTAATVASNSLGLGPFAAGGSERGSVGTGLSVGTGGWAGPRRGVALRQHSASTCDSRASSSDTHRLSAGRSTYSRSFDDSLDPRHAWRHHATFTSRQATCSDDLEEDPDVRNASMESLYSGSDRDSEVEAMASSYNWEPSACRRARFSQQRDMRRPLLRQALLGSSTCSSTGEAEYGRGAAASAASAAASSAAYSASFSGSFSEGTHTLQGSVGRYSGYGSCSNRSSMTTMSSAVMPCSPINGPCSVSTGDLHKITLALEEAACQQQEQTPLKVMARRRSASLLNLSPPHPPPPPLPPQQQHHQPPQPQHCYVPSAPTATATAAAAAATATTRPQAGSIPKKVLPGPEMFLDDALLDGNLADILFSVEALWPKK